MLSAKVRPALQIVVVPLWRRHWAFYARRVLKEAPSSEKNVLQRMGAWVWERSARQYDRLKQAKPGTLSFRLRRVADRLEDQVSPEERFLATGGEATSAEVLHPSYVSPKLARRRLRLVSKQGEAFHRRWMMIWGVATPLLLPLILSPFSNLPVVYAYWRWHSHRSASKGARHIAAADYTFVASEDLDRLRGQETNDVLLADLAQKLGFAKDSNNFIADVLRKGRWLKNNKYT